MSRDVLIVVVVGVIVCVAIVVAVALVIAIASVVVVVSLIMTMLEAMGIDHGMDWQRIGDAHAFLEAAVGRQLAPEAVYNM